MMGADSRKTRVVEGDCGSEAAPHLLMTGTTTVDRKMGEWGLDLSGRTILGLQLRSGIGALLAQRSLLGRPKPRKVASGVANSKIHAGVAAAVTQSVQALLLTFPGIPRPPHLNLLPPSSEK